MEPIAETWRAFRQDYFPDKQGLDVPVFNTKPDGTPQICQKGGRSVLVHTKEMDDLFAEEIKTLKNRLDDPECRGLIYIMYCLEDTGAFDPVYVGIAEKLGKSGKLSGPLMRPQGPYSRFGYDKAGHIGGISHALFDPNSKNYSRWPERLFELPVKEQKPVLKRQLYVWTKAWNSTDPVTIGSNCFPSCSLGFLEALLIFVLDTLYPERLLNSKGMDRMLS